MLTGLEQWHCHIAEDLLREAKKVLIGDNLSSHFSDEILRDCEEHNIAFVCLPPNATHLCQPLDVAYFAPLKKSWRNILTAYKQSTRKNAGTVPKDQFQRLLKKLLEMPNQQQNLISGFRKCGIYPLDKTPVLNRLPQDPTLVAAANSSVSEVFTQHLRELRSGDTTGTASARRVRRKRVDVVPGRSISTLEQERPSSSLTSSEPEEPEFLEDEQSIYSGSDEEPQNGAEERNIFEVFTGSS